MVDIVANINRLKLKECDNILVVKIEPLKFYLIFSDKSMYFNNTITIQDVEICNLFLQTIGVHKQYEKIIFKHTFFN